MFNNDFIDKLSPLKFSINWKERKINAESRNEYFITSAFWTRGPLHLKFSILPNELSEQFEILWH